MTDQINDQISAFIDDELSDEESAFLLRRFERDSDARNLAVRYTMIGSALRGELLGADPAILRRRVAVAMTGAPLAAARPPVTRWHARLARPLVGVGIAATVAIAAIGGLRLMNDARVADGVSGTALTASSPREMREIVAAPASYVVPQEVSDPPVVAPAIRLTNYLMHHGEYASRLSRTSVHSNVVGAVEAARNRQAEAADPKPLPQAVTE
jgi:sigma-E factor negative regulatory protein RseA